MNYGGDNQLINNEGEPIKKRDYQKIHSDKVSFI